MARVGAEARSTRAAAEIQWRTDWARARALRGASAGLLPRRAALETLARRWQEGLPRSCSAVVQRPLCMQCATQMRRGVASRRRRRVVCATAIASVFSIECPSRAPEAAHGRMRVRERRADS
eukprot:CAMPEP_0170388988 /NCGR_PEP_ID=MMETSP0117_2-20130122/18380_1 /TAXON_ID=400756 /ORGANISM="Durinskia baltica, Strain CSIRO CS-38" /LENGTH=121 /DNA_ID=CAMNT_0010644951 /DNA_START=65 /DNA_END=430 /DNA_ORIENTATION=-